MSEFNLQKIFWHSRRGMLELDLLLVPFATEVFEKLNYPEQVLYVELLEEEDQDIFNWLMRQTEPSQEKYQTIIDLILAHNEKPH
jgi:antitoxin CptB